MLGLSRFHIDTVKNLSKGFKAIAKKEYTGMCKMLFVFKVAFPFMMVLICRKAQRKRRIQDNLAGIFFDRNNIYSRRWQIPVGSHPLNTGVSWKIKTNIIF